MAANVRFPCGGKIGKRLYIGGRTEVRCQKRRRKKETGALWGMQYIQLHSLTWRMREQQRNEIGRVIADDSSSIFPPLSIMSNEPMKAAKNQAQTILKHVCSPQHCKSAFLEHL